MKFIKGLKIGLRSILYLVFALKLILLLIGAIHPEFESKLTNQDFFVYGVVLVFILSDEITDELKEIRSRIG
jgi:hypothetical protein